jgi:hypothetical protein
LLIFFNSVSLSFSFVQFLRIFLSLVSCKLKERCSQEKCSVDLWTFRLHAQTKKPAKIIIYYRFHHFFSFHCFLHLFLWSGWAFNCIFCFLAILWAGDSRKFHHELQKILSNFVFVNSYISSCYRLWILTFVSRSFFYLSFSHDFSCFPYRFHSQISNFLFYKLSPFSLLLFYLFLSFFYRFIFCLFLSSFQKTMLIAR